MSNFAGVGAKPVACHRGDFVGDTPASLVVGTSTPVTVNQLVILFLVVRSTLGACVLNVGIKPGVIAVVNSLENPCLSNARKANGILSPQSTLAPKIR